MTLRPDDAIRSLLADASPWAPGAAVQWAVDGRMSDAVTAGFAQTVCSSGAPVPEADRQPIDSGTLFDLASVTKVVSAMALLTLVGDGIVDLDSPIGDLLPEFAGPERRGVTMRMLLTHTSGLPGTWTGWREALDRFGPDEFTAGTARRTLLPDLLATPLAHRPGSHWEYSCVGYDTAMAAAEKATGADWADLVNARILRPLALSGTTFSPDPAHTAATERQPELGRGVVRGIVHDETAWSLGGTCANAGLFAPVSDVVRLGEAVRSPSGACAEAAWNMWPEQVPRLFRPGDAPPQQLDHAHTFGLRIGQTAWMSDFGTRARGHTGFTGTSLHVDREKRLTVAILTNRIHPSRATGDPATGIHALRRAITSAIYERI